jgi:RHS repeat-associated protein
MGTRLPDESQLRISGTGWGAWRAALRLIALVLLAWLAAALPSAAHAADAPPMLVPGKPNVASNGGFTYSVPIAVPPGSAGMAPSLSLEYSSHNPNGLQGLGWVLSGLPTIGRCPRTPAQDSGVRGSVNFDNQDRFCMDGQRLVAINGAYGANDTEYRTEVDGLSKIISHGVAGTGPEWFEVHTKSGQVIEFGHTPDSAIPVVDATSGTVSATVRIWAANRISDTIGNYLTIHWYWNTQGDAYPTEVKYTGNSAAGVLPYNSVSFVYLTSATDRPDAFTSYQAGAVIRTSALLSKIRTYASGTLVSEYRLGYASIAPDNQWDRRRLNSIRQCDGAGVCLPATTFDWQGSQGLPTMAPFSTTVNPSAADNPGDISPGDFNGDGVTDAAAVDPFFGNNPPECEPISFGKPNPPSQSDLFGPSGIRTDYTMWWFDTEDHLWKNRRQLAPCFGDVTSSRLFVDFDADGYTDVLLLQNTSSTNRLFFALRNNRDGLLEQTSTVPAFQVGGATDVGDFNGDGKTDVFGDRGANQHGPFLSDGDGTFTPGGATFSGSESFVQADFDGDGCTDTLQIDADPSLTYSNLCHPAAGTIPVNYLAQSLIITGDFNGDGKADILALKPNQTGTLYISTGTGFISSSSFTVPSNWWKYGISTGDFNGDGKTDVALIATGGTDRFGPGTKHEIWLSTGAGFIKKYEIDNPAGDDNTFVRAIVSDWTSDGASDIWLKKPPGVSKTPPGDAIYVFNFAPDMVQTVNNGLGTSTAVTYDRINRGLIYTQEAAGPYPLRPLNGPLYVVSRMDADNGVGGEYASTYRYAGLKVDLNGRGLLGFRTMTVKDEQTLVEQTTTYEQDFPKTGMVKSQTKVRGAVTLNSTVNTFLTPTVGGTQRVRMSRTVSTSRDLNNAVMPTTTTDYDTYDAYDNPTKITVATRIGSALKGTKVTDSTYENDTVRWYLGRLLTTTVTSTVVNSAGSTTLTRKSGFDYTTATGLLKQEFVEPDLPQFRLRTDYTRDVFGNKTVAETLGNDIERRSTTTAYDVKGRFATMVFNALNQSETWGYNGAFGLPETHTGPNGQQTEWDYDGFGRKKTEDRPDGTSTDYEYLYCATGLNCPANGAFLVRVTPRATNGAQMGAVTVTFFDGLSRAVASDVQGFDGQVIRTETRYDALGRVEKTSRPYFRDSTAPGAIKWTVNTYDALGRVTLTTFPDASDTSFAYDGLTTSVTNGKNQTTTTIANAQGLKETVTDDAGKSTTYFYDPFDNLTTITDPAGNVTTHTYDRRGRKIASADPDQGNWTYGYDQLDQLLTQTDAKSQTTTITYDTLGRMTQRVEAGLTSTWTYDTAANGIGRLASATTSAGYSRVHAYDALSRPSQTTLTIGGTNYLYSTAYLASTGRVDKVTYPSGLVLKYLYVATYGYLSQMRDDATSLAFWTANIRDAEMHLVRQTAGNGVRTNQTFDPDTGLIQTIQAGVGGGTGLADYAYHFDAIGNLETRADNKTGLAETFTYDKLNRLRRADIAGGASQFVTYDDIGNIMSKTGAGTYTYGAGSAGPHAVTSTTGTINGVANPTFAYDPNGNMTSGAGRTVTYTAFNMAATITQGSTSVGLTYDSEHKRILQTTPTGETRYLNDPVSGGMAERHFPTTGSNQWRDYIQADGRIVAQRTRSGSTVTIRYFVGDHLGSIAVISDEGGALVQRLSYDSWGRRRNADGTYPPPAITPVTTRGFTAHEMMDEVGLINMNARIYDPELGRFMTGDPIREDVFALQLLNPYSYVGNNPLSFTDPSGQCPVCVSWAISTVVKIALAYALKPILQDAPIIGQLWVIASAIECGPLCAAHTAGIVAGVTTGDIGEGLKAAALTYAQALAFNVAGDVLQGTGLDASTPAVFVVHGFVGGVFSDIQGGSFSQGFLAAGLSSLVAPVAQGQGRVGGTIISAIAGGVGSVVGGGKFQNGAVTGAFGYLYNSLKHPEPKFIARSERGYDTPDEAVNAAVNVAKSMPRFTMVEYGGTIDLVDGLYYYTIYEGDTPWRVPLRYTKNTVDWWHSHPGGDSAGDVNNWLSGSSRGARTKDGETTDLDITRTMTSYVHRTVGAYLYTPEGKLKYFYDPIAHPMGHRVIPLRPPGT